MIVLGILLLLVGWALGISFVTWVGVFLAVIGAVLMIIGVTGSHVGGRRYWW